MPCDLQTVWSAGAQISHGRKRHATVSPLLNVKDVGDRLVLAVHGRKPDQGAAGAAPVEDGREDFGSKLLTENEKQFHAEAEEGIQIKILPVQEQRVEKPM